MAISGLYSIKPWFVRRLKVAERFFVKRGTNPDALTFAAVVVSVLAGAAVAAGGIFDLPVLWLLVPVLCVVRLALNALDGAVAKTRGVARPFGSVLNELGDRTSDFVMLGSLVEVVSARIVVVSVGATALASTAGVMSLALTGARDSGGPMGKADRVAVLAIASPIAFAIDSTDPFTVAAIVIAVGGVATAVRRSVRLSKETADVR